MSERSFKMLRATSARSTTILSATFSKVSLNIDMSQNSSVNETHKTTFYKVERTTLAINCCNFKKKVFFSFLIVQNIMLKKRMV